MALTDLYHLARDVRVREFAGHAVTAESEATQTRGWFMSSFGRDKGKASYRQVLIHGFLAADGQGRKMFVHRPFPCRRTNCSAPVGGGINDSLATAETAAFLTYPERCRQHVAVCNARPNSLSGSRKPSHTAALLGRRLRESSTGRH